MNLIFRPFQPADLATILDSMHALYQEDPGQSEFTDKKAVQTIEEFKRYPEKGQLLVMEREGYVIGYALIVFYWSNEYGGNVLTVDELFVASDHRRQGVGTAFLNYMIQDFSKKHRAVAVDLEVTPANSDAKKLYTKLGFQPWRNEGMRYVLNQ